MAKRPKPMICRPQNTIWMLHVTKCNETGALKSSKPICTSLSEPGSRRQDKSRLRRRNRSNHNLSIRKRPLWKLSKLYISGNFNEKARVRISLGGKYTFCEVSRLPVSSLPKLTLGKASELTTTALGEKYGFGTGTVALFVPQKKRHLQI